MCVVMRPSSLGGGRIMRRTLRVRLSRYRCHRSRLFGPCLHHSFPLFTSWRCRCCVDMRIKKLHFRQICNWLWSKQTGFLLFAASPTCLSYLTALIWPEEYGTLKSTFTKSCAYPHEQIRKLFCSVNNTSICKAHNVSIGAESEAQRCCAVVYAVGHIVVAFQLCGLLCGRAVCF